MIYVLSGGSGNLTTIIAVTYPAGSICTCGGKKAKDTSGYALFNVKAGTYTVECHTSDNSKSKSTSVTVADGDAGKSIPVTLSYADYIFKAGTGAVKAITTINGRNQTISIGTDSIVWSWNGNSDYSACAAYTKSMIDLTNYKKLCVRSTMTDVNSSIEQYRAKLAITSRTPDSNAAVSAWAAYVALNTNTNATLTIDISATSGSYYIVLQGACSNGNVFDIWLE